MSGYDQALLTLRDRYFSSAHRETFKLASEEQMDLTPEQFEKLVRFVAGCMASAALDVLKSGI